MTAAEAKTAFLEKLRVTGYSPAEIGRQEVVLRKTLLYGLALHHPDMPRRIRRLRADEFGAGGPATHVAREAFLQATRDALESVRYFNLAALYREHPQLLPSHRRAVPSFLESLGGRTEITSISRELVDQLLTFPSSSVSRQQRAPTIIRAFLEFCFDQGWLAWNPQAAQRMPSERVFDADFFGPPEARWADHARAYLHFLQEDRNLAQGGIDYYARKLKALVQWLDAAGIRTLDRSTLEAFIEYKRSEGISSNTVSKYLYCIRPFLDFLIHARRVRARGNPAAGLHVRGDPPARRRILDETQLKQLIESLETAMNSSAHPEDAASARLHFRAARDLSILLLFALCGCRLSETARMVVADVLPDKRTIRIHGKGNRSARAKIREVVVDHYAWQRLQDYLTLRDHRGQKYLWISWTGIPLRPSGINKLVHTRLREAGLDAGISPHGLRATCASLYVKKGMDPYALKTLLGHESLKTTMDAYARLTEEELREVWKKTNPLAGFDDE